MVNSFSWVQPATVMLALGGALLCLSYGMRLRHSSHHSSSGQRGSLQSFYGGQALFLLLLGINREWGLLTALTAYSRLIAIREGWYNTRRLAQFDLIVGLGVAALLVLLLAGWYFRPILRQHWLPLVAAIGLLTYVAIRTISLHAVDALILDQVLGIPWDWLIELGGTALLVATLTLAFYRQQRMAKGAGENITANPGISESRQEKKIC
ncbi:MAG: hypothetical protein DYG89_47305 [Caldilinea sp. CFX5]|nr:hypothetical protein [Caldilinea sp. CFX5]